MELTGSLKPQSRGAQQESVRLSAYLQISALISLAMWMLLLLPDFLAQRGVVIAKDWLGHGGVLQCLPFGSDLGRPHCGPVREHYYSSNRGLPWSAWQLELFVGLEVAGFHLFGAHTPWVWSGDGERPASSFTWWIQCLTI